MLDTRCVKIPQRITAWRKHAGLSVAVFADKCGVSTAAAYQWEAGDSTPTLDRLEKIVEACGTTLADFFGELPDEPKKRAKAS